MDSSSPLILPRHVDGFDPAAQPIVPMPREPELASSTLQLPFIRRAFAKDIPWEVEPLFMDHFDLDTSGQSEITPAAVLIPLIEREKELHVLLTRRSAHLYSHAGQICFPGGRIESTDAGYIEAALRETWEEVGVEPRYIELLGSQPSFLTSSGYTMKPIIGVLRPGYQLKADRSEVAEIFEVPLATLLSPNQHKLHQIRPQDGGPRKFFSITWQKYFIWGATAALIRNLYHYLAAAEASGLIKPLR